MYNVVFLHACLFECLSVKQCWVEETGWFSTCVLVFKPVVSSCCGRGVYDILRASTSKQAKPWKYLGLKIAFWHPAILYVNYIVWADTSLDFPFVLSHFTLFGLELLQFMVMLCNGVWEHIRSIVRHGCCCLLLACFGVSGRRICFIDVHGVQKWWMNYENRAPKSKEIVRALLVIRLQEGNAIIARKQFQTPIKG